MYLEKLELTGFKSFYHKTPIEFPKLHSDRHCVACIVGPNGSGKSNILDAIRWGLGEQSVKAIRGKKSDDIIFSGSEKKGRLGFAQVSLHLNNEGLENEIDIPQIEITRRIYRDGQAEYLINNKKARLFDITLLLAKANIGQRGFSIISQGKIDSVILATPLERKEFFVEAFGIKEHQIKRHQSLNKLERTEQNVHQAQLLLAEVEPRLKSLTRQVKKLEQRKEIKAQLQDYQQEFYARKWHRILSEKKDWDNRLKLIQAEDNEERSKLNILKKKLESIEQEASRSEQFTNLQRQHQKLVQEKNDMLREKAVIAGRMDIEYEKQGKLNLVWLHRKQEELTTQIEDLLADHKEVEGQKTKLQASLTQLKEDSTKLESRIQELRLDIEAAKSDIQLNIYTKPLNTVGTELENIYQTQEKLVAKLEKAESLEDFISLKTKILSIAERIKNLFLKIQEQTESLGNEEKIQISESKQLFDLQDELRKLSADKEELYSKLHKMEIDQRVLTEKLNILQRNIESTKQEKAKVASDVASHEMASKEDNKGKLEAQGKELDQKIEEAKERITAIETKIEAFNKEEEEKKAKIFELEKQYRDQQNALYGLSSRMNECNVAIAKLDTQKENLENEINNELGGLTLITERKGTTDELTAKKDEELFSLIQKAKYQLDLIGGIDPETVEEYEKTKERYDFLSQQIDDLNNTIDKLEEIIQALDKTIKKQFNSSFRIINEEFDKYFKILFGGGRAKLTKVLEEDGLREPTPDSDDNATTENADEDNDSKLVTRAQKYKHDFYKGIDIYACPPGKKISAISMLSGGERSLTALALISAIISANPTPFVVLDEVDAALDEANSARMARIIRELSVNTQFIVMTHNRAVMNIADIIYGVTMGDDGISKILSVKLEEIDQHATKL